jgi:hypothetical protein
MPVIPPMPWVELVGDMQTGDLILFAGTSTESQWIELLTGGEFSHSTMVVKVADSPTPWLWQEAPEAIVPDPRSGQSINGAQLGDAESATRTIQQSYGDAPFYVQLTWDRPDNLDELILAVIEEYEGLPFGTVLQMALDYAVGRLYNQATGLTSMYCAELVAATWSALGLITDEHPFNWYAPNTFSPEQAGSIPWAVSASLGTPVPIIDLAPDVTTAASVSGWPAPLAGDLPPPPGLS